MTGNWRYLEPMSDTDLEPGDVWGLYQIWLCMGPSDVWSPWIWDLEMSGTLVRCGQGPDDTLDLWWISWGLVNIVKVGRQISQKTNKYCADLVSLTCPDFNPTSHTYSKVPMSITLVGDIHFIITSLQKNKFNYNYYVMEVSTSLVVWPIHAMLR